VLDLESHFQNVPLGIFHAYGKRELAVAGHGLNGSAGFIVQLPASNWIVTAANCPNVSIVAVDYFDCDWRRHPVSLDHLP
jgi:hypothetical protein